MPYKIVNLIGTDRDPFRRSRRGSFAARRVFIGTRKLSPTADMVLSDSAYAEFNSQIERYLAAGVISVKEVGRTFEPPASPEPPPAPTPEPVVAAPEPEPEPEVEVEEIEEEIAVEAEPAEEAAPAEEEEEVAELEAEASPEEGEVSEDEAEPVSGAADEAEVVEESDEEKWEDLDLDWKPSWRKADLLALAETLELDLPDSPTKAEIVEALTEATG